MTIPATTGPVGKRGRSITLAPLQTHEITLTVREVESSLPCGFRVGWLSGEAEPGDKFELLAGAGVGSPWMIFERHGREFVIDARHIVDALFAIAEDPAEWVKCPECHGPIHADWCENTSLVLPSQIANP